MLPADARQYLEQSYERMKRPHAEVVADEHRLGPIRPYWDPVLSKNRRKFLSLMRALKKLELVMCLPAGRAREQAGLFLVKKPGKAQSRIIVDARRANRVFARPPAVELSSAETFGRIEVVLPANGSTECGDYLALGLCDIRDAFHRFRMRPSLAEYFGLGVVTAKEMMMTGETLE